MTVQKWIVLLWRCKPHFGNFDQKFLFSHQTNLVHDVSYLFRKKTIHQRNTSFSLYWCWVRKMSCNSHLYDFEKTKVEVTRVWGWTSFFLLSRSHDTIDMLSSIDWKNKACAWSFRILMNNSESENKKMIMISSYRESMGVIGSIGCKLKHKHDHFEN